MAKRIIALSLLASFILVMGVASAATSVISSDDMMGWGFVVETGTGSGALVSGPDMPPLGGGSAQLNGDDASSGVAVGALLYTGERLDSFDEISYSTFVQDDSATGVQAPALQINFDDNVSDSDTSWKGRMVFEPYFTETVLKGEWQTWDTMTQGQWWGSGAPLNSECSQADPCDFEEVLSAFPDAGFNSAFGGVLVKAGSGWPGPFAMNVDAVTFGDDIYNFEAFADACTFTVEDTTMTLDDDCTTDATIFVPEGFTLNGDGNSITAVDPMGGHFTGAVVSNEGSEAHVVDLTVTTQDLANTCDAGADRLRGIMFEGAAGTIMDNRVLNINQGLSGCQEGNAIEVRNEPFDGTGTDAKSVFIKGNDVEKYQKGGIICNGDVDCLVLNNQVSNSFSDKDYLAANSVQIGFGARGTVERNNIEGNSWCGNSPFVATAVLLFDQADGTSVSQNNIRGDSDVGIYAFGGETLLDNNKVFEDKDAANCNVFFPDSIGIGSWGSESEVTNNKVRDFAIPYDGVSAGKNKVVPGPNGPNQGNPFW